MSSKKEVKFINTYENKIKQIRAEYYKDIAVNKINDKAYELEMLLKSIPILLILIITFITKYSIIGYLITIIISTIINCYIEKYFRRSNLKEQNKYLKEIKKLKYSSIEDYEKDIKRIITGEEGYYQKILNELKEEYKINENTPILTDINGNKYYAWTTIKKTKFFLLSLNTNTRPTVQVYNLNNIRYYRYDKDLKCTVLNTDIDLYYFTKESYTYFEGIIETKRFENLKTYNPEEYITDFELFMHKQREILFENSNYDKEKIKNDNLKIGICMAILILSIFLRNYLTNYYICFILVSIITLIKYDSLIKDIWSYDKAKRKEKDYLKIINSDRECVNRFYELKTALGIKNKYHNKVYTSEGACYLTWVANGYFHIFLNVIYFNVVYMVVKTSDVLYYQSLKNETIIKLKDKTLTFRKDAVSTFSKILPNKDYNWLKNYNLNI